MKQKILIFFLLFSSVYGFAQKTRIPQEAGQAGGNPAANDSLFRNSNISTSNKGLKNLDAKIEDYLMISHKQDTIIPDTTLTIKKEYKFLKSSRPSYSESISLLL